MKYQTISSATSIVTGSYAIANIQDTLSVIILILSIANILWNMAYRIYNHVKNKRYEKISEEIQEAKDQLNDLKEDK